MGGPRVCDIVRLAYNDAGLGRALVKTSVIVASLVTVEAGNGGTVLDGVGSW